MALEKLAQTLGVVGKQAEEAQKKNDPINIIQEASKRQVEANARAQAFLQAALDEDFAPQAEAPKNQGGSVISALGAAITSGATFNQQAVQSFVGQQAAARQQNARLEGLTGAENLRQQGFKALRDERNNANLAGLIARAGEIEASAQLQIADIKAQQGLSDVEFGREQKLIKQKHDLSTKTSDAAIRSDQIWRASEVGGREVELSIASLAFGGVKGVDGAEDILFTDQSQIDAVFDRAMRALSAGGALQATVTDFGIGLLQAKAQAENLLRANQKEQQTEQVQQQVIEGAQQPLASAATGVGGIGLGIAAQLLGPGLVGVELENILNGAALSIGPIDDNVDPSAELERLGEEERSDERQSVLDSIGGGARARRARRGGG